MISKNQTTSTVFKEGTFPRGGPCRKKWNLVDAETSSSFSPSTTEVSESAEDGTDALSHTFSSSLSLSSKDPLPKPLVKSIPRIYKEQLEPIDMRFGVVRKEDYSISVRKCHKKVLSTRQFSRRAKASVAFIVKRPGCIICKEQGLMLQELVQSFPENRIAAWAVVKEIDVDNEGLAALYQNYFRFPFFLDKKMKLYKAMGKNVINPFKFFYNIRKNGARKRIDDKGIEGTFIGKGEGLILGGVLIFDAKGNIRYAYQEKSGAEELPIEEFRCALNAIIAEQESNYSD
ncbi:AhpC/TSA antioxidant enzyme [Nitzschia inconspicua]|uniref:AhpC/TSA antioxidant enzyme n=1 Tax=Nitzschia inconspicua TaxID=303405 RepID=A0A9K3KGW1_9STRA|nr:AhpC/TSA antioxidant enzyme [Nitzschia inconspicua]